VGGSSTSTMISISVLFQIRHVDIQQFPVTSSLTFPLIPHTLTYPVILTLTLTLSHTLTHIAIPTHSPSHPHIPSHTLTHIALLTLTLTPSHTLTHLLSSHSPSYLHIPSHTLLSSHPHPHILTSSHPDILTFPVILTHSPNSLTHTHILTNDKTFQFLPVNRESFLSVMRVAKVPEVVFTDGT